MKFGIIFSLFGLLYLIKPNIYRRGIWKETEVAQRKLSREKYLKYVRMIGLAFLIFGIALIILNS